MFIFKYGAISDHDNLFLTTSYNFSKVKYYKRDRKRENQKV